MLSDNCESDQCGESCKEFTNLRLKCDMSGTLEIFKEFNEVYKERLRQTDCAGGDATALKLKTLKDWVDDLTEQNTVLVETVEALEKEALFRLGIGVGDQQQGSHHDLEVKECRSCKFRRGGTCGSFAAKGPISHSSDELHSRERDKDAQLQELQEKLLQSEKEIEKLKKIVAENEGRIEKINEGVITSEKCAREMRAALTAEVAEKHDQVLALRREVQHLEDKLRQADMQTHFKDDIIKELRKEIKIANSKLQYLGLGLIPLSPTPASSPEILHSRPFNEGHQIHSAHVLACNSSNGVGLPDVNINNNVNDKSDSNNVHKYDGNLKPSEVSPESNLRSKDNLNLCNYGVYCAGRSTCSNNEHVDNNDNRRTLSSKNVNNLQRKIKKLTKNTLAKNSVNENNDKIVEKSCGDFFEKSD